MTKRKGAGTSTLRRDGAMRRMHPRHVVMATGVSGIPNLPDIPSLKSFSGTIVHSSRYDDGENWHGKRALVIGTGNSGHDIAQDLHSSGADVTLVQRSPTLGHQYRTVGAARLFAPTTRARWRITT